MKDGPTAPGFRQPLRWVRSALRWILAAPVVIYRAVISPLIPARCIYSPTCSHYAIQAIHRHGLRGLLSSMVRVSRCIGGLYKGGDDPVPEHWDFREMLAGYRKYWNHREQS